MKRLATMVDQRYIARKQASIVGREPFTLIRRWIFSFLVLSLAAVALAGCASSGSTSSGSGSTSSGSGSSSPGHVFVIMMENRTYEQAMGGGYTASLAKDYAGATDYYAITHPSLPNYLALTSGSTWDVTNDKYQALPSGQDLGSELTSANIPWRAYMEDMSEGCFDSKKPYALNHNPFAFYGGQCPENVVNLSEDLSELDADLSGETPNFVWITPNLCHQGHDCSVSAGDQWLEEVVPKITDSDAWKQDGVLFIVWDEDDKKSESENRVALIVVAPDLKEHQTDAYYDHYSLLATIEDRLGVERLGDAEIAQPIEDLFQ